MTAQGQLVTCMTALDSMGTGLLSMVLRLLSRRCQVTDGRGSPEAWHSRLMGSPSRTLTGPRGVTDANGDSGTHQPGFSQATLHYTPSGGLLCIGKSEAHIVCMYVCVCVCVYTHIYIIIYMCVYIYITSSLSIYLLMDT